MGNASRRIVIGIGNPRRGDDAVGHAVVRLLRGKLADAQLVEHDGEPLALAADISGAASVHLVDACTSGAPQGTVHRFDAAAAPLPQTGFRLSTHGLGLAEAIELARALGELPKRCIVYAIEGSCFAPGAPISPAVARAAEVLAERLYTEIASEAAT